MGKLLKKYLLVFLLGFMATELVYAAATKFTNVEVTGTAVFDGAVTESGAVTSTGNNTATGTLTRTNTTTLSTTTFTGGYTPYSRTIAQINGLQSTTTGQIVFCSDCVRSAICVSTGTTAVAQWSISASTATVPVYTSIHCQ